MLQTMPEHCRTCSHLQCCSTLPASTDLRVEMCALTGSGSRCCCQHATDCRRKCRRRGRGGSRKRSRAPQRDSDEDEEDEEAEEEQEEQEQEAAQQQEQQQQQPDQDEAMQEADDNEPSTISNDENDAAVGNRQPRTGRIDDGEVIVAIAV